MTPRPWVEAFAPATVSNLGPGFDCLGLALRGPGDTVRARRCEQPGVFLRAIEGDDGKLPRDETNTACVAVREILPEGAGIELELVKGLPLGSGLGSSGASACAALLAAEAALSLNVGSRRMIDAARLAEKVACGTAHPDNVAPAILGGIVLIVGSEPQNYISLPVPDDFWLAVYTPGCSVKTADARAVLPKSVSLHDAVVQSSRLAMLVHGLHSGDASVVGQAIVDDIVEPARAHLIPGYLEAKVAALEAGALACTISGAGPTTFALCDREARAKAVLEILDEAFHHSSVPGQGRVDRVGLGARVTSQRLH